MQLQHSLPFNPGEADERFFNSIPEHPAVFALDLMGPEISPPYLGRTLDLRRRLRRLLGSSGTASRRLNLRHFARRIQYTCVGSGFEAHWWLYVLNKSYYPDSFRQRLRLKPPALLRLNLSNRFPRLYPTRRLTWDGSLYYGPFPSRLAAERLASEFLDFFKIRRCVEDLSPDPAHPGCIYSQMKMCLAPFFGGCTDEEYQAEVRRVAAFLVSGGRPLIRSLEEERAEASEALEFERAGRAHRKIEKVHEVLRQQPELARNLSELHAVMVHPGAELKSVVFFRVVAGEILGPAALSFDENVPSPVPLDEKIRAVLEDLAAHSPKPARVPPWEHLSLLARWCYSSFRQGELVMLESGRPLPHARLIRACRRVLASQKLP